MNPAIIIGIIVLCACLISSSVGGYLVMNASPAPEPDTGTPPPPPVGVEGCMDSTATNYSPSATEDDDSCLFDRKAVFKFNGNDGKVGCFKTNINNSLIQGECSPELEQYEIDVIANSSGTITDVKTCFVEDGTVTYDSSTGSWVPSTTKKSIKIGDGTDPSVCKKYTVVPAGDGTIGTIGGKRLVGYAYNLDAGTALQALVNGDEALTANQPPVKLHLVPK